MNEAYKVTIGLEVHAELKTQTKMFCDSKNDPDEKRPNVNVCPVCMGYPGTLPVANMEAIKHVIRVGTAINGTIADYTEFDRKNYFYPDIPKGYQITQYKYPFVTGGELAGVKITRIHLEEDTARSSHDTGDFSLVDFNRAGIPLMELVTEPVIHSAEQASMFAKELQLLLQTLGVGEANMEKGEMRVEANISVSKTDTFGTKCEVKNLNSFRAVERAIAFEVARHIKLLEEGSKVVQETRGWDEVKEVTFSQRVKEDSHDYRYFPEPDLPKIIISEVPELNPNTLKQSLPELPWEKRERLTKLGLKPEDVEVFVRNRNWGDHFNLATEVFKNEPEKLQIAASLLTTNLAGIIKKDSEVNFSSVNLESKVPISSVLGITTMMVGGSISSTGARRIIEATYSDVKKVDPESKAKILGVIQNSDEGELTSIVQSIIDANPNVVAEYKSGKVSVVQFLVGQGMKATKGSGNPAVLKSLFEKILG